MDDDADTVMPADGAGAAPAPRPTSNGTGGAEGGRATPAARRKVTLLLVGAGNRGTIYTQYALENPDLCTVVGVAEPRKYARAHAARRHGIPPERVFTTWEDAARVPRFADAVIVTTQDSMHVGPAVAFADLGYHMLLEKPMAVSMEECYRIVEAVKRAGVILAVGHVLRYMPYTRMFRELIASGAVGRVVNVQHLEPIGHWHFAHSYVRGNWRKESEGTFMLMAKCCHDIDWLSYVVGRKFSRLSSFGSLYNFKKEHKPEGAASRCLDCKHADTCPYSAKRGYLDQVARGYTGWPISVCLVDDEEPTVENVTEALRNGPYGRCAWECDNDVMDNQVVNIQFDDGCTANLTTVAYTKALCVRHTRIFGTLGELEGDGDACITQRNFVTGEETVHRCGSAPSHTALGGHNGADFFLIQSFIKAVSTGDASHVLSGPDETLDSHLAVFAAEEARHNDTVVDFKSFVERNRPRKPAGADSSAKSAGSGAGAGAGAGASASSSN